MKALLQIFLVLLAFAAKPAFSQNAEDTLKWDEVKGKVLIKELDQIMKQIVRLKETNTHIDSTTTANLDTIDSELYRFKVALRRRNKYAAMYKDDYAYYNEQLNYIDSLSSTDSINSIIDDIKKDLMFKTQSTLNQIDTSTGYSGHATDFSLIKTKFRVFNDSVDTPLNGFEVFIRRGTIRPSRDSVSVPALTDNAVFTLPPGRFTIIARKRNEIGVKQLSVVRGREPMIICDIKIKQLQ